MSLFREQALAAYSNPDARGGLVRAAPPSGLVLFVAIAGSLVCASAIAANTSVDTSVVGRGVIALEHGPLVVRATRDAIVTSVFVQAGAQLDHPLALIALDGERVLAPTTGHVEFVDVREGDVVARGTPLVEIAPDREPLVGYLLVPVAARRWLAVGQEVHLRTGGQAAGSGTIADISAQPISATREEALFGAAPTPRAASLLVRLSVPTSAAMANGTVFEGAIQLGSRSALSILVPALADDDAAGDSTERSER